MTGQDVLPGLGTRRQEHRLGSPGVSVHPSLPPLTNERQRTEVLVECFVGTDGLGVSRLRRVARVVEAYGQQSPATLGDRFDLGSALQLLSIGSDAPFLIDRRGATGWREMSTTFRAALAGDRMAAPGIARSRWWLPGDPGWTDQFGDDDDAPGALSVHGSLGCLAAPRAAIVGTRSASAAGLAFARQLAFDLARSGVSVISGLARGIDGAAHRGAVASPPALEGGPVGILGNGIDVAYPSEHRSLQQQVRERGVLLSEYAPTQGPRSEAFPQRNRIVAQLAQVIVVVESASRGGSLLTVNEAVLRGRPILAVPSNPLVRSAAGTNELLRRQNGDSAVALPCHDAADVLAVLDVTQAQRPSFLDPRVDPTANGLRLLQTLGWDRRSTSSLVASLNEPLSVVVRTLTELEDAQWVHHVDGMWVRRSL